MQRASIQIRKPSQHELRTVLLKLGAKLRPTDLMVIFASLDMSLHQKVTCFNALVTEKQMLQ